MFRRWRQSLVYPTLLRIGVGATLLIAGVTVLTYTLIFRAVEERGRVYLEQYVAERTQREEARFLQVRDNLQLVRRTFLERYEQAPGDFDYRARWDAIATHDPDGAWRSPRGRVDGTKECTVWAHRDVDLTPELLRRTIVLYDVLELFRPVWIGSFRSLWFATPEMTNVGFDPLIPVWVYNTPADWAQNDADYLDNAGPRKNPERKLTWTFQTQNIPGGYFYTVCLPVYDGDRLLVTFGHDVHIPQFAAESMKTEIAGITHMMFKGDGNLVAHATKQSEILAANGRYSMQDDPALRSLYAATRAYSGAAISGFDSESGQYYAARRLTEPDWFFMATLPRALLEQQAFRHAQWVLWAGIIAIVVLLAFVSTTLNRSVARPLRQLTGAVDDLSAGTPDTGIEVVRDDELGKLASSFNRMARTVAERDSSLRELNADLERRIAERTTELQSSEARMRAMLEHTPEAIVVIDADTWQYRTGNENVLRFLGVDRETLRKSGPGAFSPATQPDGTPSAAMLKEKAAAVLAGGPIVFEWTILRRDGTEVPTEIRLSRLPADNRNLLIGTITDISERKQAEASMLAALARERELGEMKSGFVSMVSHEFRTPLGIISSSSEILARYFERLAPDVRAEHLDTIFRSTRALNRLIDEVLLLGKVEAGRITYSPAPINLPALCGVLADEVRSSTGHECPIELQFRGELGGASGDESILRHIFTNLLSNAAKYSSPGGTVSFEIERAGHEAIFRIRDRGIGIAPEDLHTLFTAFRRGRNVGTRTGTGLGLVIVKRCADLHGGSIDIESEPGKGTCATVRLPLFAEAAVSTSPSSAVPSAASLP